MDPKICRFCFEISDKFLDIFSEEGIQRNVQAIIGQHFWFQIENTDEYSKKVCLACWTIIENFHCLYKKIDELHKSINWNHFAIELIKTEINPDDIKNEVLIKPEEEIKPQEKKDEEDDEEEDNYSSRYNDDDSSDGNSNIDTETDEESEEEVKSKRKRCTTTSSKKGKKNNDLDLDGEKGTVKKRTRTKRKSIVEKPVENEEEKAARREQFLVENDKIRQFCKMECNLCSEKFVDFANASRHYRVEHKIRGYLMCCNRKLLKRCRVLQHIRRHIDPEAFKCQICNKTFLEQKNLSCHMDNFHASDEPMFKCDKCPKAYFTNYRLLSHKKFHNEKSHCCPDCGKGFVSNSILQSHIRNLHSGDNTHVCDICARSFKTKMIFNEHRKVVHGTLEKVQCAECGVWLKHVRGLKRHMVVHAQSDEKHICNVCGKQSPNKHALENHIKFMHKLERTHACDFCDKSFKRALALKEHMTTHTGEVLYTCTFCPKTFNSSANMHAHRKKMHPVEWAESKFKNN